MSITVACSCGKRFKTADQNAGRKARCSACGAVVRVPVPAAPTTSAEVEADDDGLSALAALAGEAEVFRPATIARAPDASTAPAKVGKVSSSGKPAGTPSNRSKAAPEPAIRMVTISPLYIVLAILALVIPSAIYAIKQGPLKAERQWTERSRVAEVQIPDQIVRAMVQYYRGSGLIGEGESTLTYRPKIFLITFGEPKVMVSLPDHVLFSGRGTEGSFDGHFDPQTMQFDADVKISGTMHKVTGSASEEDNTVQLDGKTVTVH